jgi:hypothetical protein
MTARIPAVSVIMPVWRPHQPWLTEAVTSVLSQRGIEIELIVVDDGCDQPVSEVLASIDDPRMRIVRIGHAGHSAARNAGIAAASGTWLRFVDSDDVVMPDSTSYLAALTSGDDGVIAYGGTLVCDERLRPQRLIASTLQGDVTEACLLGAFDTRHVSMLFSRRVVDAAGPWDTQCRVSGDWDFVLRALEQARVRGDLTVATLYRRHRSSVSKTADVGAGEASRRRLIEGYLARHPEQRGTELERRAWSALYLDRGAAYLDARQYGASALRLASAVRATPVEGAVGVARILGNRARRLLRSRRMDPVIISPSVPGPGQPTRPTGP